MSEWLSRALAIYFIVIGTAALKNEGCFRRMVRDFVSDNSVLLLAGVMALIIGALMVAGHNLWVADWRVTVTVIGWLVLIKGVVRLLFPAQALRLTQPFLVKGRLKKIGYLSILLGIFFGYYGFL